MAGSLIGNGRGHGDAIAHWSEINVTPLVDVMLVLLIVFMVAAPLSTVGVPVDLPKTEGAAQLTDDGRIAVRFGECDGVIFLQETEVPQENLVP